MMPVDMTLYFDVIKQIQDQINRITYANQLSSQERLNQLSRLEHEISQKFHWARRSIDTSHPGWPQQDEQVSEQAILESTSSDHSTEMDVA